MSFLQALLVLTYLAPILEGFVMVPFAIGARYVRPRASGSGALLTALDPAVLAGVAAIGLLASIIALAWGWAVFSGTVAFAAAAVVSCRVRVVRRGAQFVVERRILGVAWRTWRTAQPPEVVVDGWGDFMDPEALVLVVGEACIELAWNTARSGLCFDALARECRQAFAAAGP